MPVPSLLASLILLLIFFLLFCGVVGSWSWVVWRMQAGQAVFPRVVKSASVPWGLGSLLLVLLTWLITNIGLITIYVKATTVAAPVVVPAGKGAEAGVARSLGFTEQMVVTSLINGALLLVIPLVLKLTSQARLVDLGLDRRRLGAQLLIGTLAFFLIAPFVYMLNGLAILIWKPESHPLEKMIRNESSMGIAELAVLSAVILAPAAEELIFRGVIQRWLSKLFQPRLRSPQEWLEEPAEAVDISGNSEDRQGEAALHSELTPPRTDVPLPSFEANPFTPPTTSLVSESIANPIEPAMYPHRVALQPIFLTSLLFALVHFPQWPAPLAIFFLSLGLGIVFERSGSLIAAMVMHALFNGLSTLLLFVLLLAGGGQALDRNVDPKANEKPKAKANVNANVNVDTNGKASAKVVPPPPNQAAPEQKTSKPLQSR